ncbi:hypothetical protein [Streptomyces radicis]|uniref:Uncharacterized protein n=1 Tax=Streptomyces radicis TaxID=1750517 RepID=A0A3A9WUL8_9ACTN|nr:hypothetical protein [Streptomyces radicis]RKN09827.1 hypothetical protein D7319_11590 [Streptomyces radicis]RKN23463.1 hypothetical protein D7318_12545 [Streptomyces radicis]
MEQPTSEEALHRGRALVLADLVADGVAGPEEVSMLEEAVSHRRWWCDQWPAGAVFVTGLLAQDIQDALLARHGRWPLCQECDLAEEPHALDVEPELGEDPHWVCLVTGRAVAAVGSLAGVRG